MINQYRNMRNFSVCSTCKYKNVCFLRYISLQKYSVQVQDFIIGLINTGFLYCEQENKWYANYWIVQEQLVRYYDIHNCKLEGNEQYYLTNEEQRENDRQKIRELFKQMLDMVARETEDKNPEASIVFYGIGFVLASDYSEAVDKMFSMLKTAIKSKYRSSATG